MKTLSSRLFASFALIAGLSACSVLPDPQVDPVRYFTLSKPVVAAPVSGSTTVRSVQLAPHLRGRKMAVRVADHEVIYLDDVNWAAPLDDAILSVLRGRLGVISSGAVVTVQVQRCELVRNQGDQVQLSAVYTILPPGGEKRSGVFVATPRTWDGKNNADLVNLIGDALDELGEAIATALAENK